MDQTHIAGKTNPQAAAQKLERKLPMERGIIGHLSYGLGMACARRIVRLRAEGLENIRCAFVIAANRETYVDGMLIALICPKVTSKFSCIAAKIWPAGMEFGPAYPAGRQSHPIDRLGNPVRGLIIAKKKWMREYAGPSRSTRSLTAGSENERGASYISFKSRVPLLPVFIDGAYEVFNRYMKVPRGRDPATGQKREVILTFGKPFDPADYGNAREMTVALNDWMQTRFQEKKIPRIYRHTD